jgi:hypothetical protein
VLQTGKQEIGKVEDLSAPNILSIKDAISANIFQPTMKYKAIVMYRDDLGCYAP